MEQKIESPLEKWTRIYIKMREKKAELSHELEEKVAKVERDMHVIKTAILEHGVPELLVKSINQANMKAFLEEHPDLLPPGLNANAEYSVTIKRSK